MNRAEFPRSVKNAALERSGGQCEAVGARYGLPAGTRCQRRVFRGRVQFDHYPHGARSGHPDVRTLGNCWATCPECNQYAANHTDKQVEQRVKNLSYDHAKHRAVMQRKAGQDVADPERPRGRQGKKRPLRSAPFRKGPARSIPSRPFPKPRSRK